MEVGAVVTAAEGGGCVEGEVRGGGVEVTGDVGHGVDGLVTVVEVVVEGEVVEERVVGDGGEKVEVTVVASVVTTEGVAVVVVGRWL